MSESCLECTEVCFIKLCNFQKQKNQCFEGEQTFRFFAANSGYIVLDPQRSLKSALCVPAITVTSSLDVLLLSAPVNDVGSPAINVSRV